MSYSVPYSFIPGTKARAQDVNANFNSVTDYLELLDASKVNNDLSNISAEGVNLIKNNSSRRNIGELIYTLIPLQDANLHLLDGTLLYSGVYSDFIDYIANLYAENPSANYFCTESDWQSSVSTYGVCGKFVYDSTNNTVRLPKVTGKIDGTTDINALGDLEPLFVRLPNITGSSGDFNGGNDVVSYGAMYSTKTGNTYQHSGGAGPQWSRIYIDASRSSSVYSGNGSDTAIHEQAIKCFVYIVIATSSKTEIQTDIDEVVTDLNGKADTDLSNINASQSAKNTIVDWVMPDYSAYFDITSDVSTNQKDRSYAYPVVLYGKQNTGGSIDGNNLIIKIGNFQVNAVDYSYGEEPVCVFIPANTTFKCYLSNANVNRHQVLIVPLKGGNYA